MKKILCAVFCVLVCVSFAQTAFAASGDKWEKPTWNVGDRLLDLSGEFSVDQLVKASDYDMSETGTVSSEGTVDFHAIMEVKKINVQKAGVKNYEIEIDVLFDADVKYKVTQTRAGYTTSIDINADAYLKIDGKLYLTMDEVAFTELSLNADVDVFISAKMNTNDPIYRDMKPVDVQMDADIEAEYKVSATPPIDLFDFPVVVGEHWNTTETAVHVKSDVTGTMKTTNNGTTETEDMSEHTDEEQDVPAIPLWAPDNIENPTTVSINGKDYKVFIIEVDVAAIYDDFGIDSHSGKSSGVYASTPSLPFNPSQTDLYYSQEENRFVGIGMKDASGSMIFDSTKIAPTNDNSPFGAGGLIIIAAVVAAVIFVVIVVVIVLLLRKNKTQPQPIQPVGQTVQAQQVQYVQQPYYPQQVVYQQTTQYAPAPAVTTPQQSGTYPQQYSTMPQEVPPPPAAVQPNQQYYQPPAQQPPQQ